MLHYIPRMSGEVHRLPEFYASPEGEATAALLRARLVSLWPRLTGQSVLGLGHAAPYLPLWQADAARCIALTPAQLGASRWPAEGPCASLVAAEDSLPFPDLSFDRVLMVHGLEAAESSRRLLREAWRVLKDDGRLLIVVPNRRGLWARFEHTPFGHGQPYSPSQIEAHLSRHMFCVERREAALFLPPIGWIMRRGRGWDRAGRRLWPDHFAGLVVVEAVKDMFSALPAGGVAARRQVLAAEPA